MLDQLADNPVSLGHQGRRLLVWLILTAWVSLGVPLAGAQTNGATGADQALAAKLAGTWKLLSLSAQDSAGRIAYPLGKEVRGRLSYEPNGRLAVQIMSWDRPRFATADPQLATEPEVRAAMDGYVAYYGTYTVNQDQSTVVHHIEASLIPNWVGADQVRHFELEGNRLTIKGPLALGGIQQEMILVWERQP